MSDGEGIWTQHEFDESAKLLSRILSKEIDDFVSTDEKTTIGRESGPRSLLDWRLVVGTSKGKAIHGIDAAVYLTHPTVYRTNNSSMDVDYGVDLHDDCLVDESILDDPQSALNESQHTITTAWQFSIVYSHTWRVPILYFRVQDENGSPLTRSQVLGQFTVPTSSSFQQIPSDTWDFISEEMHPVTGTPACFLHPCQTTARMLQLTAILVDDKTPQLGGNENEVKQKTLELWSWIALILPAVQYAIPSKLYTRIQTHIKQISIQVED